MAFYYKKFYDKRIFQTFIKRLCGILRGSFDVGTPSCAQMNVLKNLFQHNAAARIYTRTKIRKIINQTQSMSTQQVERKDKEAFHNVLSDVLGTITSHPGVMTVPGLEKWMKKLYSYNLTGGKFARGLSVVSAYQTLEKPELVTEESMRQARLMGWCVEMFQSYLIIIDDMMDGSTVRRGQPCWHLLPEVGTSCTLNDAVLLYNGMLYAVKKHFGERRHYREMLDTINETLLNSAIGQFLDLKTSSEKDKNYTKYTPETHHAIIKYKTAYYTYDLPIYLGYLLTDNKLDVITRKQIQDLCLELGMLFQIQDDYIDCYSDPSLTGKLGTDIQEGKCSWLAVSALQRCTEHQKVVFKSCYGSKEPAHIERIKQLYNQLQLPELYKEVEKKYYEDIVGRIDDLPSFEWKTLFHNLLRITYNRKK